MLIISRHDGFIIFFETTKDLKETVERLNGYLEAIEKGKTDPNPPHLYAIFNDSTNPEESKKLLQIIKSKFQEIESENV